LRFRYSKDQLGTFLQTVYEALFGKEQQVGRIVDALAERDVREALGMFARMLSSGHFNADRVIKIGVGDRADIKHDLLIKTLMRADYRVYSDKAAFVRNIFASPADGFSGNIFLTVEILGFFAEVQSGSGRLGTFRSVEELLSDMASMGFEEDEVREQVQTLISHKLLSYDGEDNEAPADSDLIKITPSGFIHLRSLPHFIEYISSAALHMPIDDRAVAQRIADVWRRVTRYSDLSFSFKHDVASMTADYLVRHKNRLDAENPLFKERSREAENVVRAVLSVVNSTKKAASRQKSRMTGGAGSKDKRQSSGRSGKRTNKSAPEVSKSTR
ncbi:MAG: hypothetical protein MI741_14520, partial [Rhodospirillales bacterium]|nr:hypothetical protein [Rhodospirillales bacterium]